MRHKAIVRQAVRHSCRPSSKHLGPGSSMFPLLLTYLKKTSAIRTVLRVSFIK